MKTNSETKLYAVMQLDLATVQEFQLEKEIYVIIQLLTHFRKKVDSRQPEKS